MLCAEHRNSVASRLQDKLAPLMAEVSVRSRLMAEHARPKAMYAALLVSPPRIADLVQALDREADRLIDRAMEKQWSRDDFRKERRALGRLAAEYLNASRAETGWSPSS